MKVMISNPMLKVIKQALKEYKYSVTLEKLTYEQYRRFVDFDVFAHMEDYNGETFKCFRIAYPCEYYAEPQYITTRDLTKIFRNSNGTMESFTEAIKNYCEI